VTDPLRYFRIEARELAEQMGQAVLELDRGPDPDVVARLLRLAHTLKGAARVVRQPDLADRAHALEDLLVPYREAGGPAADEMMQLLALSDEITAGVEALDPPPGAHPPAGPAAAPVSAPERAPEMVPAGLPQSPGDPRRIADDSGGAAPIGRSPTSDVDELLDAIGEAHVRFAPLHAQAGTVQRLRRSADAIADQLRGTMGRADGRENVRVAAATLAGDLAVLSRRITDTVEQVERELDEVRGRAERLRLVAASSIFTVLHRAVHDAAQAQQKRVVFRGHGGDLRIDPQMLAQASSALLHVVRNAVAHGIEPAGDRALMGKPAEGSVVVEVVRRGRYAVFRCTDDGRGFDLDAVRRAAQHRGLLPPGALPGADELVDLVLRGGISTSESVTEVSGRGIGLDVVRDMAEHVGGTVRVETSAGAGSTVELSVPLALLSLHGLVVAAAGTVATLPLDAVRTCVRLGADTAATAEATGRLPHDGAALPFVTLAHALDAGPADRPQIAVVVSAGAGEVAVGIDELLGTSTLVVRPLPELAPASPVIGGVSLDVEGNPRAVLDPAGLIDAGRRPATAARASVPRGERPRNRPILVVDDSLTTRMLERSILESAGYEVDLAASAEEALLKARLRPYLLFLTDIDMPGMNGFEFVEHTRADPDLAAVPAILVSSRASAEDRQRGLDAGAGAYVVKGEFDQEELLAHIRELVGR
jgi:two-component system chemotaxis sensor kinase CheA